MVYASFAKALLAPRDCCVRVGSDGSKLRRDFRGGFGLGGGDVGSSMGWFKPSASNTRLLL